MSLAKLKYEPISPEVFRRWVPPLVLSLIILFAGAAWTWHVGQESNAIDHHLSHLKEAVDDLRAYVNLRETPQQ